jgi:ketosteroid isomerase-like protein
VSFIDCVNRGDVDGLGRLMAEDHTLRVFDEAPVVGREANLRAWRGYADSFPNYVIYPHRISDLGGTVAVLEDNASNRKRLGLEEAS